MIEDDTYFKVVDTEADFSDPKLNHSSESNDYLGIEWEERQESFEKFRVDPVHSSGQRILLMTKIGFMSLIDNAFKIGFDVLLLLIIINSEFSDKDTMISLVKGLVLGKILVHLAVSLPLAGLASALDVLITSAAGAISENQSCLQMAGVFLQRARYVSTLMAIPCYFFLMILHKSVKRLANDDAGKFSLITSQDSLLAETFVYSFFVGSFLQVQADIQAKFLTGIQKQELLLLGRLCALMPFSLIAYFYIGGNLDERSAMETVSAIGTLSAFYYAFEFALLFILTAFQMELKPVTRTCYRGAIEGTLEYLSLGCHQMAVLPLDWWITISFFLLYFSFIQEYDQTSQACVYAVVSVAMNVNKGSETGVLTVMGWSMGRQQSKRAQDAFIEFKVITFLSTVLLSLLAFWIMASQFMPHELPTESVPKMISPDQLEPIENYILFWLAAAFLMLPEGFKSCQKAAFIATGNLQEFKHLKMQVLLAFGTLALSMIVGYTLEESRFWALIASKGIADAVMLIHYHGESENINWGKSCQEARDRLDVPDSSQHGSYVYFNQQAELKPIPDHAFNPNPEPDQREDLALRYKQIMVEDSGPSDQTEELNKVVQFDLQSSESRKHLRKKKKKRGKKKPDVQSYAGNNQINQSQMQSSEGESTFIYDHQRGVI